MLYNHNDADRAEYDWLIYFAVDLGNRRIDLQKRIDIASIATSNRSVHDLPGMFFFFFFSY